MDSFNPNPESIKDQGRQLRSGTVQEGEENDDIDHGRKLRSGAIQERMLTMKDIQIVFIISIFSVKHLIAEDPSMLF